MSSDDTRAEALALCEEAMALMKRTTRTCEESRQWRTDAADLLQPLYAALLSSLEREAALLRDVDPPVCRLQLGDGTVPGNAREAAELWHAEAGRFWMRAEGYKSERDAARAALAEAERQRDALLSDNLEMDGTDFAHPSWWRGNDAGVAGAVRIIREALDGPIPAPGGVGGEELERARRDVEKLRAERDEAQAGEESVTERWARACEQRDIATDSLARLAPLAEAAQRYAEAYARFMGGPAAEFNRQWLEMRQLEIPLLAAARAAGKGE